MNSKKIERRLPDLLRETAEQVSQEVDLRQRIAARLLAQPGPTQANHHRQHMPHNAGDQPMNQPMPRPRLAALQSRPALLMAALIAVLVLASAFAFARPLVLSWFGDSSLQSIALQDGTPINRSVKVQGVTLTLDDGYADAARTVLTMHFDSGDTKREFSPAPDIRPRLVDAQGTVYTPFASSQLNEDALMEFSPLPSDALGTPQELTFVIDEMSSNPSNPQNQGAIVTGPWQIAFQLTPQAGHAIALDVAPETHGGITLQPERLDLTPAGVRLLVRESGLPPDTVVFSVKHFATHLDDILACPPGQGVCGSLGGSGDGARMQLAAPGGQTLVPGWVNVVSPAPQDGVPINQQAVGPSGTAEIEFLFFSPVKDPRGTARVTFDEVRFASATGPSAPEQSIPGPWSFTLSLA